MLRDMVDLSTAILSFETVLKIEYTEPVTKRVIDNAIKKLEISYGLRMTDKTLYELELDSTYSENSVQNLLSQILECTKTMSFLLVSGMYAHSIPITLSSVKYLGLGRESLKTILRYFQNTDEYYLAHNAVGQLSMSLDSVDKSSVKQLFIILLLLDRLGVKEAVAVIAQYLYYGSVWDDFSRR